MKDKFNSETKISQIRKDLKIRDSNQRMSKLVNNINQKYVKELTTKLILKNKKLKIAELSNKKKASQLIQNNTFN